MTQSQKRAVVIGGSMSGLFAARALADYYDHVTVLERDTLPEIGQGRKGVPQGYHAHGLLSKGAVILENFFPGFAASVVEHGGRTVDLGHEALFFNNGGFLRQPETGITALMSSRPLLEGLVRSRLFALPNVHTIENCDVVGLVLDGGSVTGVRLVRSGNEQPEEVLSAEMVVDSSGRGSRLQTWLTALGYTAPDTEQLQIGITYTTAHFRDMPNLLPNTAGIFVGADPTTRRGGVALRCEDGWRVTLIGFLGEESPLDMAGFAAFARTLPTSAIYDLVTATDAITDAKHFRFPSSQRRRYEAVSALPVGLVVSGDALCSFNPVYGQGMTIAMVEAELLHRCLAEGFEGASARYFARVGAIVDGAWNLSVGSDLIFPEVEGTRTRAMRFMNWYFTRVTVAAHHDDKIARLFHGVTNMTVSPAEMMAPGTVLRVLWQSRRAPMPVGG